MLLNMALHDEKRNDDEFIIYEDFCTLLLSSNILLILYTEIPQDHGIYCQLIKNKMLKGTFSSFFVQ